MKEPGRNQTGSSGDGPLIGIPCSEIRPAVTLRPIPESEPQSTELALSLKYVEAVEAAGGIPLVIPLTDRASVIRLVRRLDGILLPGGPDVDPSTYGEPPHEKLGGVSNDLDQLQFDVVRAALGRDLPLIAICRGMQLLNVTLGGSLIQHLPDEPGSFLSHRQCTPGWESSHPVTLDSSSLLAQTIGQSELEVNSFHHQAVKEPGTGIRPIGKAPDGTIEALEVPGAGFVLGVQWHAELMNKRDIEGALFSALVERAADHVPAP
jgi:putative glutamine amidotransferase